MLYHAQRLGAQRAVDVGPDHQHIMSLKHVGSIISLPLKS